MPLVSILIPAFNHERFVERCLDSVLEDPYPAKEIVIIDDGSTDRTGEIIAAWVARHGHELPVEYVHRDNRGIAVTLNELAARARGEFLRLGASDDYLLPGGIEAQVNYLVGHPGKWAVIGDSVVVDKDGKTLHESGMRDLHGADKHLYQSDDGIRLAVISHWAIGGPVALVRKRALETVAGWSDCLRIDDWDFFLRLAAHDAIGFVDVAVCAYRIHGSNLSRTRHTPTRVLNLMEAKDIAMRRAVLFHEPYRTLLMAQSHFIGAKISFLQGRIGGLLVHMMAYLSLVAVSKARLRSTHRIARAA
ncbi:glycosyltransferase [Dyella soli]|uniref:Glycosyltransferase n=2 Tax=Dyella soli TaxID=522319 RepID=A0A4R0YWT3_9GAMM|nr:glycosyltransferase [Dyella soli]